MKSVDKLTSILGDISGLLQLSSYFHSKYHNTCQIIISFIFKVRFLFLSESRRNQTVNYSMCGIMGFVAQFVILVGYLGCDVKKIGLQLHLVFLRDISHHIFWEI